MRKISFCLTGDPIPQQRHRMNRSKAYNPQAKLKESYKLLLNSQIKVTNKFNLGPLAVKLSFFMRLPVSRKTRKNKISQHTQKPDIDNLIKFILDVMAGIIYSDDACIYKVISTKSYSDFPRTEIHVTQEDPAKISEGELNGKYKKKKKKNKPA